MKSPALRFAAGTPDFQNSSVWRLWANGDDVYLAGRSSAGLHKYSLHQSGVWVSAMTEQSGQAGALDGNRRQARWDRPKEFTRGWTRGPVVLIPWTKWQDEIPFTDEYTSDTIWIAGPSQGNKVLFNTFFSGNHASADTLESISRSSNTIGSLDLATMGKIWLEVKEMPLSDEDISYIEVLNRSMMPVLTHDGPNGGLHAQVTVPIDNQEYPIVAQFNLGTAHLIANSGQS